MQNWHLPTATNSMLSTVAFLPEYNMSELVDVNGLTYILHAQTNGSTDHQIDICFYKAPMEIKLMTQLVAWFDISSMLFLRKFLSN